jgi:hypothetical protein
MPLSPLDAYFSGLGELKLASPNSINPADAYFDALGLPASAKTASPAAPLNPAFDAYLEGFGKRADLMDQTPGQMLSGAWDGITNGFSNAASGTSNGLARFGDGLQNVGNTIIDRAGGALGVAGNSLAAIPRSLAAQVGSLSGGGSFRDAANAAQEQAFDPVASSWNQMTQGSSPAAPIATPAPAPVPPKVLASDSPAASPAVPAPAAPGPDWVAHFKKQTGSNYNPHSVVDRMKMMGFQRGLNGGQADQASSLANRQKMMPGAGGAAANQQMLSSVKATPGAINLGVKAAPKPPAPLAVR